MFDPTGHFGTAIGVSTENAIRTILNVKEIADYITVTARLKEDFIQRKQGKV